MIPPVVSNEKVEKAAQRIMMAILVVVLMILAGGAALIVRQIFTRSAEIGVVEVGDRECAVAESYYGVSIDCWEGER